MTNKVQNVAAGFVTTFAYDVLGRPVSRNGDAFGNRVASAERGTNVSYSANSLNQYTAVDDFVPQFDDDGNQTLVKTTTGIWSVTYNGENRPILWTNGSTNILMSFDRMGRRVRCMEACGTITNFNRTFAYDGYLQIASRDAVAGGTQSFAWDPTEPVATRPLAWISDGNPAYYTHDGNKDVSEVVADDGEIAAHYEYAPFGAVTKATSGDANMASGPAHMNPFRFSSEYADDPLGLVYYNYRHYLGIGGRWMNVDPIENLSFSILNPSRFVYVGNTYLFERNQPPMAMDALGLTVVESDQKFPGANHLGSYWWLYVDDGQSGTVELIRCSREELQDQMRSAAIQLCLYQRDDWIPTRAYEGGFDTGFFAGEGEQHSYYLIDGETQIWADNEVNYIGIGMYEAWLGSPKLLGDLTIILWKTLRWRSLPTRGTFYWYNYGYDNFDTYYSQLDKCTCKPADGSEWYYNEDTYIGTRQDWHRNSRYGR